MEEIQERRLKKRIKDKKFKDNTPFRIITTASNHIMVFYDTEHWYKFSTKSKDTKSIVSLKSNCSYNKLKYEVWSESD